jgi:hypothetical protein
LFHNKNDTFSVVFHHGDEFVRADNNTFYRGGVQTVVSDKKIKEWNMLKNLNLVKGRDYEQNNFRVWTKFAGHG